MGYNRSGHIRKQRLKRRKRHLQRLQQKAEQTASQPQAEKK